MVTLKSFMLLGLLSISFILSGCGGGGDDDTKATLDKYDDTKAVLDLYDDSESHLDEFIDNATGSSGGGGGGTPNGEITYLDCSALDPNKVYFVGTLRFGFAVQYAIIDPESPTRIFCVGFEAPTAYLVSTNGVIYDNAAIRRFLPDELTFSETEKVWAYPEFPQTDDASLSSRNVDSIFLRNNTSVYFQVENRVYSTDQPHSDEDPPYYGNLDGHMHIITPDGGIVFSNDGGNALFYVDPAFNRVQLALPVEGTYAFMSARMHGNDDVWIHVIDSDNNDRRWNLHIPTQLVTDDGVFSSLPSNLSPATSSGVNGSEVRQDVAKMNSSGELVQMAVDATEEGINNHVLLKRSVTITGAPTRPTQVLLTDANYNGDLVWYNDALPYVHLYGGIVITGF